MPDARTSHDERIFDAGGAEAWTDAEAAAARGLLSAGLDLWEEAARAALAPDPGRAPAPDPVLDGLPLSPPRGAPGPR